MSKKKRKKRRAKRIHKPIGIHARDRHHICYQGRNWSDGYAKAIRNAFIRPVPIIYHRELHNTLLDNVPRPSEELLKQAWLEYQADKERIDNYGITRAIAWLYTHIPDEEFRRAMQIELDFFTTKGSN